MDNGFYGHGEHLPTINSMEIMDSTLRRAANHVAKNVDAAQELREVLDMLGLDVATLRKVFGYTDIDQ